MVVGAAAAATAAAATVATELLVVLEAPSPNLDIPMWRRLHTRHPERLGGTWQSAFPLSESSRRRFRCWGGSKLSGRLEHRSNNAGNCLRTAAERAAAVRRAATARLVARVAG